MPRRDLFIWFGWRLLVLGQCQQQLSLSVGQFENDWLTDKYSLVIGLSVCLCVVTVLCKERHLVSRCQTYLCFAVEADFASLIPVWS